jgi:hypothetical protein
MTQTEKNDSMIRFLKQIDEHDQYVLKFSYDFIKKIFIIYFTVLESGEYFIGIQFNDVTELKLPVYRRDSVNCLPDEIMSMEISSSEDFITVEFLSFHTDNHCPVFITVRCKGLMAMTGEGNEWKLLPNIPEYL